MHFPNVVYNLSNNARYTNKRKYNNCSWTFSKIHIFLQCFCWFGSVTVTVASLSAQKLPPMGLHIIITIFVRTLRNATVTVTLPNQKKHRKLKKFNKNKKHWLLFLNLGFFNACNRNIVSCKNFKLKNSFYRSFSFRLCWRQFYTDK